MDFSLDTLDISCARPDTELSTQRALYSSRRVGLQLGMLTRIPICIAPCALLCLATACPKSQPPPAQPQNKAAFDDVRIKWEKPRCFGYAAETDSYACLDFAMRTDAAGPEELKAMDFSKWEPEPDTVYSGHKSFALVGAEPRVIKLAEKAHDSSTDIAQPLSQLAALVELDQKGYRPDVTETPLEPGEWIDIADMSLRFRSQFHGGDAKDPNDYYTGSLQLVCPDAVVSSAIELLPDKRGQEAIAFVGKDAKSIVVSILQSGGKDGGWFFKIANIQIDPATRCAE